MTTSREALAGERDYLLGSLADLEREHAAGDLDELDYSTLRAGYVARAAELLRQLEELEASPGAGGDADGSRSRRAGAAGAPGAGPGRARRGTRWRRRLGARRARRALVATGCACLAGVALVAATSLAGVRLPGETATGTVSMPTSTQVRQDLDQAAVLGSTGQIVEAVTLYEQVLALEPKQPEALANLGWLDRLAGLARHDQALVRAADSSIADAVALAPGYPAARAFDGIALLADRHDQRDGLAQLRAFLGDRPQAALLDALGPSLVRAFGRAHEPLPPALARFEDATGHAGSRRGAGA